MRLMTLATVTLLAGTMLAGLTPISPSAIALAQPAPPQPPGADGQPPGPRGPMMGGPMEGAGRPMPDGMRRPHGPPIDPSLFAMMYRPADRKLTQPEVQKIAEAILLWFGNRTWKVTDMATGGDNLIGFAYATGDGSVIARFTMDTRTGRVVRTG